MGLAVRSPCHPPYARHDHAAHVRQPSAPGATRYHRAIPQPVVVHGACAGTVRTRALYVRGSADRLGGASSARCRPNAGHIAAGGNRRIGVGTRIMRHHHEPVGCRIMVCRATSAVLAVPADPVHWRSHGCQRVRITAVEATHPPDRLRLRACRTAVQRQSGRLLYACRRTGRAGRRSAYGPPSGPRPAFGTRAMVAWH